MRGTGKPTGIIGKALERAEQEARQHEAKLQRANAEPDDFDTLHDVDSSPVRGMVVGLAPALLVWAGLISLFTRLQ